MTIPVVSLALFGPIGTWEAIVLLVLGLLIFGRRLPEVGKSLGKGIVEFRKGLAGIEREVDEASHRAETAPPPAPLPPGERVAQERPSPVAREANAN